ncbi:hypothetical protein FD724_06805 [Nostoc sp. C057]|uniref:hypothetical protein n=1 Tax=Nostoc sp. C057 TaxID=2576903 RepID=UPI0015C3D554|nr:hypothetical protein [Nostoc sp. C057]QLE47848.1 hypothetical protein FD724_06805 [Nostoc sp. C057]
MKGNTTKGAGQKERAGNKKKYSKQPLETELPREYREIVKDVADLYAGIKVKSRDIPQLKASGTQQELGYPGLYDPTKIKYR